MAEAAAILAFKWLAPVATELLKKGYSELVNKGYSFIEPFIWMDANEKLRNLQNIIMPQTEILIEAVENSHKEFLRGWLKSLEEAVYEADDVLDLHDYYRLEQEVKSNAGGFKVCLEFLPSLFKDLLFSVELKKSLMKLENTAAKVKEEFLPFLRIRESQTATESRGRDTTTSRLEHIVFGRDNERDTIVDLLHETAPESSSGKCYSIVAIVGVGGAGKTTLAQYVCQYEKEAKEKAKIEAEFSSKKKKHSMSVIMKKKQKKEAKANHFDVIMWVHMSQILNVEQLTKKMVEAASEKGCDLTNLDNLQGKLEGFLKSKKFLLVFDDVWSEKELEKLLAPLRVANRGSKILITTREKRVAKTLDARNILHLEELEKKDFLSLFTYHAFGDANIDDKQYEELKEIVRQNAPKLHGSPLAAVMVGRQLRGDLDVDEWKRILSGDLLKDTMKSLLWSYQNLKAHLQRCFSYCSLFSKGQKIRRKKLIHLWIAEGFIKTTDERERIEKMREMRERERIEKIGQEYFHDLLSSSFFQPTEDDDLYTIHDLLHDLAEMVSKDRCHRVEGNLTEAVVPPEIRHLSLRIDHHLSHRIDTPSDLVEKICNLKNLRTLIFLTRTDDYYFNDNLMHYYFTDDLMHIFVKLKKLRVVDLGEFRLRKLPESIGGLKHLRYLDLSASSVEILPKSIYALYHLEFLHINYFSKKKEFLHINYFSKKKEFLHINEYTFEAKGLANWKKLHHLCCSRMILNVAGIRSLKQLGNLRNFQGLSVHINGLENVKEKGEASVEIEGIEELCLEWSTTDNISRLSDMDAQVLDGLRPPPHLHRLKIVGYQGCLLPSWMVGDRHLLHNLMSLELVECRQLKQLPILSPTLTRLVLSACSSLPIVSKEDLAIISFTQEVRISQVVTFMEGLVATYGSHIVSEIEWDLWRGYDKQKLRNWLEKAMGIVYQNRREDEVRLVLPPSLESLDISSCLLTNSTLMEGLRGLTSLKSLKLCNIVSLTSLPSADVLRCLTMLQELHIQQCWFLTSLGGLQTLGSLETLFISFCPSLSSILPSSLESLEIEACYRKHLDDSQPDPTSTSNSEGSDIPFAASLQQGHLESLWKLSITNCPTIDSLLGLQELNNLEDLTLTGCPKLAHAETKLGSLLIRRFRTDAPSLLYVLLAEEALASLLRLDIVEFKEESFRSEEKDEEQVFQHLTSLKTLRFESCSIKSLPNTLQSLSSLEQLHITDCPNVTSLPDLPISLFRLHWQHCNPVLKRRCQKPHGQDWCKIWHIPIVVL